LSDRTRFSYVEITRTCGGCGRPLPVNGPLERVRCASCFTVNPVPMLMFQQVLEIVDGGRNELAEGETRTQTPLGEGGTYRLTWGKQAPRCRECSAMLPEVGTGTGESHCPTCGAAYARFAPPELFARLYPAVRRLVLAEQATGEVAAEQQLTVDQSEHKPILMGCENCGGSLSITADVPRLHSCQYCGARVGIPDELWERLHPVESTRGWYLELEGALGEVDRALERQMGARFDDESLALARKRISTDEGPSRFARLQIHTKCPSCKHPVPINGPLPHVVCPECGAVKPLPAETIGGYMAWVGDTQPIFDGVAFRSGDRFQMKCARVAPYCERCDTDLPLVEPGADTVVQCPGCAAKHATFPVPGFAAPHAGIAKQVYCAQRHADPSPGDAPDALGFCCPACGGELSLTSASGRVHECEFCSANVFVPDEVWTQLHPVARVRPWFVDTGFEPARPAVGSAGEEDGVGADDDEERERAVLEAAAGGEGSGRMGSVLVFVGLGAAILIGLITVIVSCC